MQQLGINGVLSFLRFGAFLFIAICLHSYTAFSFQNSFESSSDYGTVIGIHLGESYSQAAVNRNGTIEIITDEHGRSAVPSYVAFLDGDVPLVGFDAKEQATRNPQNTIYDVRRLMGRNFSDPDVQLAIKALPYSIENQEGQPVVIINTNGGKVTKKPEEIIALIVAKLKVMAEKYLETPVHHTVISVPAYFNDVKRQETKDAAFLGGLATLRLVNEPTSIGIAYQVDKQVCDRAEEKDCVYLLYNVREKESELALLSVEYGVFEIFGTALDRKLGGSDFDIPLEAHDQTILNGPSISTAKRVHRYVKQLLDDVKLDKKDIDGIIVTGEAKHIAKVEDVLTQYLPNTRVLSPTGFHQDQAIVNGVAVQGLVLSGEEGTSCCGCGMSELLPLALGFEMWTGAFKPLILRNSMLPTYKKIPVSTVNNGQDKIVLKIFEGQREVASKNKLLGTLEIAGLAHIGEAPDIEISFEVDPNGESLIVQARGHGGLVSERVVLDVKGSRYQYQEFDDIVEDAEKFHEEDLKQLFKFPLGLQDGVILLE